ncbi:hypothetical protein Tco_0925610 [Tanacetum coccineum]|uniref:Uncharacterized protein n=1 Tax=Tanacetum coccineum TaxID=301880 RepID=A0ABQ5DAA7_9ASTR
MPKTYEGWTNHLKFILMELVISKIEVGTTFQRSPVCWAKVGDVQLTGPEIIYETTEKKCKFDNACRLQEIGKEVMPMSSESL